MLLRGRGARMMFRKFWFQQYGNYKFEGNTFDYNIIR